MTIHNHSKIYFTLLSTYKLLLIRDSYCNSLQTESFLFVICWWYI